MAEDTLKYKPLAEAILELRWNLVKREGTDIQWDPHHKVFLGRMFDRLQLDYPETENLPAAGVPDEMVPYVVQHRLRKAPGSWPLVQLGPGIISINETEGYSWETYSPRCQTVISTMFLAYPGYLTPNQIVLRYVNAIDFDAVENDALAFIKDKLKLQFILPEKLFDTGKVDRGPVNLNWQTTFTTDAPKGAIVIALATGKHKGRESLVLDFRFVSKGDDIPPLKDKLATWLEEAHKLTKSWFFTLIEGELENRFRNGPA